jgi:hypothetical protein
VTGLTLIRYFVVLPSTNSGDPERHSCQTSEKIFIADWVKNEGKPYEDVTEIFPALSMRSILLAGLYSARGCLRHSSRITTPGRRSKPLA